MFNNIKLILTMIVMVCVMTGCKPKNYTYDYLTQHPDLLSDEYTRCKDIQDKKMTSDAQCKIVFNAVENITAIIRQQRVSPEKFGMRIMFVESSDVDARAKKNAAKEALDALKAKSAPEAEIKKAQLQFDQAENSYKEANNELKMLLAIIGMSSPE